MKTVNIHEAKTHLSRLLDRVAAGEEIVIAKAGQPVARLVAIKPVRQRRTPGTYKGRVKLGADFDKPLPEDLLKRFEKGLK
jgi:prevent-host-death family protein